MTIRTSAPLRMSLFALSWLCCAQTPALTLTTEEFPPLNFSTDGGQAISGSATDLMREILRRTGIPGTFVMLSWRSAYKMALEDKDTCVFATARTEEREKLFQWVGPLATGQWIFCTTPNREIVVHQIDDLRPYMIGSYQSDVRAAYLKEHGFHLDEAMSEEQNLKKLAAGKIDLWLATDNSANWLSKKHGIALKPVHTLRSSTSYAACNRGISPLQIERMNAALRNMFADGTVERLLKPYGVPLPPAP